MAIVTSDVNVKFNSKLDDVVILHADSTSQTVIMWDNLPVSDQTLLTKIIDDLGGNAPLAAPVAGFAAIEFDSAPTGVTPTGLDNVADATGGTATITFSVPKVEADASGLAVASTSGYQTVIITPAFASGTDATGLANDTTVYTATIAVDGTSTPISVEGSAAQTVADLVNAINADLGVGAQIALVDGNLVVTSKSTGIASTVAITDVDLFDGLTGTAEIGTAVAGTAGTNTSVTYTATIEVDGIFHKVTVGGDNAATVGGVATEIGNDLGSAATVEVTGGAIVITSASVGPKSSVRVFDSGWLFSRMTNFSGITYTTGINPVTYTVDLTIDGTIEVHVEVQGSDAQTFGDLMDVINSAMGGDAVIDISGSAMVIVSDTTGATSSVVVSNDRLFKHVAGYTGQRSVAGASNLVDAFRTIRMPNGTLASAYFPTLTVGVERPLKPVVGSVPKDIKHIYWGGSPADWLYLNDNSEV